MAKQDIDISARNWRPNPLAGPIALVTTVDENGYVNVAPKSWISFVTARPCRLVIGCHRDHHTARNLLATGECVLNFPGDDLAEQTWSAHLYREPGPDELAVRGFTPLPAVQVTPPRLAECRAHLECRLETVHWYGDECVLVVLLLAASVDEEACRAPDPYTHLRPIFFLEPSIYGTLERSRTVARTGP